MRLTRLFVFAVAVILMQGAVKTASADGIGTATLAPGLTVDATLTTTTTGTWTLTFDVDNASANTVDLNSFALQIFQAGSGESFTISNATVNGSSSLGVWEFFADDKLNNGSSPLCNAAGSVKGWACGDTASGGSLSPFDIASGTTAVFDLSGTFTDTNGLSAFDLMASGCTEAGSCILDGGSNNGNKFAFSAGLTPVGQTIPEPGSLSLLGLGLVGLLGVALVRRSALDVA